MLRRKRDALNHLHAEFAPLAELGTLAILYEPECRAQQSENSEQSKSLLKEFHLLFDDPEVCNSNSDTAFDNDNFSEGDEAFTDVDVNILSGGTAHLDDAAGLQFQNFADLHHAAVKFDGDLDRDILDECDCLRGIHFFIA